MKASNPGTFTSRVWDKQPHKQHNPDVDPPMGLRSQIVQLRMKGFTDRKVSELLGISIEDLLRIVASAHLKHSYAGASSRMLQKRKEDEKKALHLYQTPLRYSDLPPKRLAVSW